MSFIPPLPQATDPASMQRNLNAVDRGFEHTFEFPDTLAARLSPRWYPRRNCTAYSAVASVDSAGSSDTVVWLYKNGSGGISFTLGSGVNLLDPLVLDIALLRDADYLQAEVATVGSGSPANLSLQVRCR